MKKLSIILITFLLIAFNHEKLYAVSYTWNGNTSTAWGTNTNWTPNGVPGAADNVTIVTRPNAPVYNGVAGVTNITVNSGSLNLGGYTLNASGTGTFTGGTINNGKLVVSTTGNINFSGTVFNCKLTITGGGIFFNGCTFKDTTRITRFGGTGSYSSTGGNKFYGYTEITSKSTAVMYLSNASPYTPDTAWNTIKFNMDSTGAMAFAHGSNAAPSVFYGKVYITKKAASSGADFYCASSGKAEFHDTVFVTNLSSRHIYLGNNSGSSVTLKNNATLKLGASGFTGGTLYLKYFNKQNSNNTINLSLGSSASISIGPSSTINGAFTCSSGNFYLNGCTFNGTTAFTKTGTGNNVSSGGNIFNADISITNSTASSITLANTTGDDYNANATFTTSSSGAILPAYNKVNTFAGNITATGGSLLHFGSGASANMSVLDGTTLQTISGTTTTIRFKKLTLNKSTSYASLSHTINVTDSLKFVSGVMETGTYSVQLNDNGKASGANNTSHIVGKLQKTGNDAFTFPVGRYGYYRPISISAPSVTTAAYTAEYFLHNSDWLYTHTSKDAALNQMSRNEYWNLTRDVGSSNISVTLTWDTATTSCTFASTANLKIANWNGTQWKDKGNGGVTGNIGSGTIVTNGATSTYGTFTLGSTSTFNCVFEVGKYLTCGDYEYTYTDTTGNVLEDSAIPYHFFDRFGNKFKLEDLIVDTVSTINDEKRNTGSLCTTSGYFNLIYEYNWAGNLSPAEAVAAQNVICQVYSDLSEFINPVNSSTPVNIWIRGFSSFGGVPPTVKGLASPIYALSLTNSSNHDIADNQVWRTINSGQDAYTGVAPLIYPLGFPGIVHGMMAMNFSTGQIDWHTDMTINTTAGLFDLYTAVLHEATHLLGFSTLIDCDGGSQLSFNYYNRYDLFLEDINGTPLITNTGGCDYFGYTFNSPTLTATTLLSPVDTDCNIDINNPSCQFGITACSTAVVFGGIAGNVDQAVYTPMCYQQGSSLSHLEDICYLPSPYGNDQYYVMSEGIGPGLTYMKRYYKEEERTVLCDLGYSLNTSFGHAVNLNDHTYSGGSCNGVPVVGVHDGIDAGGLLVFTTTPSVPIVFTATGTNGILNNDYNADNYICPEVQTGSGSITVLSSTSFSYNPGSVLGPRVLKYIPIDENGVQGNLTFILVYVKKNETCCTDDCNMVSNGGFENAVSGTLNCSLDNPFNNLKCWYLISSTPDIFYRSCTGDAFPTYDIPAAYSSPSSDTWNGTANNNNHFIGLYEVHNPEAIWNDMEGIQTTLCSPIQEGHTYKISLWAKVADNFAGNYDAPLVIGGAAGMLAPTFTYNPALVTPIYRETIPADDTWHHIIGTYTHAGDDLTQLTIAICPENPASDFNWTYVYIDDVKVVDVEDCCTPTITLTNATWSGGSTLGGLSVYPANTITDQTFKISGTLTIDYGDELIFDNCDIYMDTDAEIYVSEGVSQTGGSLTVTDNTHIHSCDDMWYRIHAPNGAELFINNEALIEDAEYGVYVEDGTNYQIDGAVFNKNLIHVGIFRPFTSQEFATGYVINNKFLCQETATIGTNTPVFTNLLDPYSAFKTGAGVYAIGEEIRRITIGTSGNGNYFQNASYGIIGWGGQNEVKISDNVLNDIDVAGIDINEIDDVAYDVYQVDIINNQLNRMPLGIYCYDVPAAELKIKGNTIDFAGMTDDEMWGIKVEEIAPLTSSPFNRVSITENAIYNAPTGIWTINLQGDIAGGTGVTYIGNNTVTHTKPNNDYQAGILFENCIEILVIDNEVSNPVPEVNSHEVGIRQELGSNNYLFCNDVHDIGKGIYIYGVNSNERLVKNKMQNSTTGLYLHNSVIGAQGTTSNPHDNEWNGAWIGANKTSHLEGASSVPSGSVFIVQNVTQFQPINNSFGGGASNSLSWSSTATQASTDGACPIYVAPAYKTDDESQVMNIKSLLENETLLVTDLDSSVQWMGDFGTYRMMNTYSYLKNVDPKVDEFYAANNNANTGKLERAIGKTHNISKTEAGIYLDSIRSLVPSNKVELRLKQVLEIMYSDIKDSVRLNPVHVPVLREIAKLCPYTDGFGVYMARALLHKVDTLHFPVYKNECERVPDVSDKMEETNLTGSVSEEYFKVYPNPTSSILNIEYGSSDSEGKSLIFEMYDVFGRIVKAQKLNGAKSIISTDDLQVGIYHYSLRVEGEIKYSGKEIIIK
jgi:hypothetical protein